MSDPKVAAKQVRRKVPHLIKSNKENILSLVTDYVKQTRTEIEGDNRAGMDLDTLVSAVEGLKKYERIQSILTEQLTTAG